MRQISVERLLLLVLLFSFFRTFYLLRSLESSTAEIPIFLAGVILPSVLYFIR